MPGAGSEPLPHPASEPPSLPLPCTHLGPQIHLRLTAVYSGHPRLRLSVPKIDSIESGMHLIRFSTCSLRESPGCSHTCYPEAQTLPGTVLREGVPKLMILTLVKFILKLVWKNKWPQIAKSKSSEQEKQKVRTALSYCKTYHKVIVR